MPETAELIIEIPVRSPPSPSPVDPKFDLDHLVDFTLAPYSSLVFDDEAETSHFGPIFVGCVSRGKTIAKNFDNTENFGVPHFMVAAIALHPGRGTLGVKVRNQFARVAFGGFRNVDGFPIVTTRVPFRGSIIKFITSNDCVPD